MNFRNNFFQNNNVPGYQYPISYNNQFSRSRASMNYTNVPMPVNARPNFDGAATYPAGVNNTYLGYSRNVGMNYVESHRNPYRNSLHNYNSLNNSYGNNLPINNDPYLNSRTFEANNRRATYYVASDPVVRARRRWTYYKDPVLEDSYNYDDYHDNTELRNKEFRKNYKSRFFSRLAGKEQRNKKEDYDDYDDEYYSKRDEDIRNKKRSKSRYDEDYDDYDDEYYSKRDENVRNKKRSKSRYDEDYDDYDDDYDDEKDGRKRVESKLNKSRYDEMYDDYDDELYESKNRRMRRRDSEPIDFFKKKRRV